MKKQKFSHQQSTPYENVFIEEQFEEVIFPSIWEQRTFDNKIGEENTNMMWKFKDKGDRDICLVPEITAMAQEMWNLEWSKTCKSKKIFYVQKCFRYERPQQGRYREFTQLGVESLGTYDSSTLKTMLKKCLDKTNISYQYDNCVKRGLTYYVEDGFECKVSNLGTQSQIAGGGSYREGCGWAIGIDRLVLSLMKENVL